MPKTKISEFSSTAGNNTDIDGINIAEGCAPSGINDAIRELMAQLKDFQAGTAGDSFNGPVGTTTPAAGAFTNLSASGTFALTGDQVQISEGGTGQTTANGAFNALAPSQTSNAGKYLKTDGTNASWDAIDINTADITGTLPIANGGTGITSFGTGVQTALGQNVTGSGGIVLASSPVLTTPNLGTPSAATLTNATGLPISTGVSGLGTGVATALAVNTGSAGAFVVNGGALGTPSSGTVTNLTGTASININGTVGATTPNTGSFTTLTTSSTVTINGGTANGVAYLDGSKVLTTGSGFTFNGAALGLPSASVSVGLNTSGQFIDVINGDSTNAQRLRLTTSGTDGVIQVTRSAGTVPNLIFRQDASELMRLTSTGLGIGTSSPSYKLDITGPDNSGGVGFGVFSANRTASLVASYNKIETSSSSGTFSIGTLGANAIVLKTNNTDRATLDSSGNLGIGTSSPGARLEVAGAIRLTDANPSIQGVSSSTGFFIDNRSVGKPIIFRVSSAATIDTTALTIDSSGNLGIGTSSPGGRLDVQQDADSIVQRLMNTRTTGNSVCSSRIYGNNGATQFQIDVDGLGTVFGAGALLGMNSNHFLGFKTNNTERVRITSGGNVSIGGTADRGTTVGSAALQLFNGTAPAGTLTNGVSLYSQSGDLRFMDAAGNAYQVGFRNVPRSGSAKTTSYTLATTDVGEYIEVGSGGSITIPDATFATGDVVSIFNNTSGNITITCTITTAYIAGTDSDKATMTLATRGVATILFISGTVCVVSGNVT